MKAEINCAIPWQKPHPENDGFPFLPRREARLGAFRKYVKLTKANNNSPLWPLLENSFWVVWLRIERNLCCCLHAITPHNQKNIRTQPSPQTYSRTQARSGKQTWKRSVRSSRVLCFQFHFQNTKYTKGWWHRVGKGAKEWVREDEEGNRPIVVFCAIGLGRKNFNFMIIALRWFSHYTWFLC